MKLTMVASPPTPFNLKVLRQLGVDHAVHYDMDGLPDSMAELSAIKQIYDAAGLSWKICESGPALDRIVLGKPGWQEQIAAWQRTLPLLGELGVEVIAYNFMPQITADAMVIRTDFQAETRGGALTSRFRAADMRPDSFADLDAPLDAASMWQNLERFLENVLPCAESAGIRLAMHPDDPPYGPICGYDRIMGTPDDYRRLLAFSDSRANAMTLCMGCFAERDDDIVALIHEFAERIAFVHVRDIRGTLEDFIETFPDDGKTDMVAVFQALRQTGYDGYVRSDHAPLLDSDSSTQNDGYAMHGHIFALGYLRGLVQSVEHSTGTNSGQA